MFVGRREDGTIYGLWTVRQWKGQEELPDDHADVVAFVSPSANSVIDGQIRAIEQKEVMPVGASEPVQVAARIVAATNRDLDEEIKTGAFRADLYYRLVVYPIHLPPLRDRKDDIGELAEFIVRIGDGQTLAERFRTDFFRALGHRRNRRAITVCDNLKSCRYFRNAITVAHPYLQNRSTLVIDIILDICK